MALLNYTTKIAAEKTAGEIQARLVKQGAKAVLFEYSGGILSHIAFRADTPHGEMAFRLPANTTGVLRALQKDKSVPKSLRTNEQAARVAWRIIKDWVEAQLAIIQAEMATLPQVFLPYAQGFGGKTLYECFEQGGLPMLENQNGN